VNVKYAQANSTAYPLRYGKSVVNMWAIGWRHSVADSGSCMYAGWNATCRGLTRSKGHCYKSCSRSVGS